jgi:hypothetical protein
VLYINDSTKLTVPINFKNAKTCKTRKEGMQISPLFVNFTTNKQQGGNSQNFDLTQIHTIFFVTFEII